MDVQAILLKILATLGLVGLNAFFVAAEFAAVGARRSRLKQEADAGNFIARLALDVKKRLDLYLSTCQLGITIASLSLGYVTEPAVAGLLEPGLAALGFQAPPGSHHWLAITIALAAPLLAQTPTPSPSAAVLQAMEELNEAARVYREGKFVEAQAHSEKALLLDPQNKTAPVFCGSLNSCAVQTWRLHNRQSDKSAGGNNRLSENSRSYTQ